MFYFYMILYCVPGFYYGAQLSLMTNLGRPIIRESLGIIDSSEISNLLGIINLSFGIGKLSASVLAGSIAKQIGKQNCIYLGMITNVASCVLAYFPNEYLFIASRVIVGATGGFNSTIAPRLIIECYPTYYRGIPPTVFGIFLAFGVCFSYSIGEIFGNSGLNKYWYWILLGLGILLAIQIVIVFLTVNHDTPMYYSIRANEAKEESEKEKLIEKRNQIMKKFYKHKEDLQEEKDSLDEIASEVQNKSTEKSLRELIYNNCISPKTRWSFLAMMAFNFWPPFAGLTYADSYMTEIFDKLVYDGFGYKLTFYSGFFVVAGNLCTLLIVERVNRVTLLCCAQLVITICMWLLAFCFYFN